MQKSKTNFGRILLLSTALVISINTIAGGRSSERNLMLKIALGNMLSINPERAVSSSLFCKSMVTKHSPCQFNTYFIHGTNTPLNIVLLFCINGMGI
jgi:hypothetical protein